MRRATLRGVVLGVGLVRLGAGVVLGGAPAAFLRYEPEQPAGSSNELLLRTVGIRDLALGLGTVRAAVAGSDHDLEQWLAAGLVSDVLDVGAGVAATRATGGRGLVSALVALPVAVADVWAARLAVELRRAAPAG